MRRNSAVVSSAGGAGRKDGMGIDVKICGLTTAEAVAAAAGGGARYVGFVFFSRSPRALRPAEAAALAATVPEGVRRVGLLVDPDDAGLDAVTSSVPIDLLQLHGNEPPERLAAVRARTGLPVIKAIAIGSRDDLSRIADYEAIADMLLFDAQPPADAIHPGGNARTFDWTLLHGLRCRLPWLLAGGLDAANVTAAVRASGALAVDVSSGVETQPGVKSLTKITRFLQVVAALEDDCPNQRSPALEPRRAPARGND